MAADVPVPPELKQIAEAVRRACIEAALAAYEDSGVMGLCAEGRWEAAIGAMQSLDIQALLARQDKET